MPDASDWFAGALAELDRASLHRRPVPPPPDALLFSTNDYLDLARDERVREAAARAAREHGAGGRASRLVAGTSALHEALEKDLAAFERREAARVFGTGYMAALGAVTALAGEGDLVALDKLVHASLVDGARLSGARLRVFPHGRLEKLERLLARGDWRRALVVVESVYSMDGDRAPLAELAELCGRFGAMLLVDEAHATGVLGPEGRGLAAELGVADRVHATMGTLSKAFGSLGGFIAGSRALVDWLANRSRSFIYTTAPPPAPLAAAREALRIARAEGWRRERCLSLAARLRAGLAARGFDTGHSSTQIVPVILGGTDAALSAAAFLAERGLHAPAIRPPTVPAESARLRLSVTAAHTEEDIARAVEALRAWREASAPA